MLNRNFTLLLCLLLLFACQQKETNSVAVKGQINQLSEGTIYIHYLNSAEVLCKDTLYSDSKGCFEFNIQPSNGINPITLFFVEQKKWTTLFAEPGDRITIDGTIQYVDLLSIRGGAVNNDLDRFKQGIRTLYKERIDLLNQPTANEIETQVRLAEINLMLKRKAKEFIREHPTSIASVVLIQDFFYQEYDPVTKDLISILEDEAKTNKMTLKLSDGIINWY